MAGQTLKVIRGSRSALRCGTAVLCLLAGWVNAQGVDFGSLEGLFDTQPDETPAAETMGEPVSSEQAAIETHAQQQSQTESSQQFTRGVTYEDVSKNAEAIGRHVDETLERTRQFTLGTSERVKKKLCPICKTELLPKGECLFKDDKYYHPRCPECNAELLADRSCPNYLNHRHREPVSGDVPAIVLLAILVVAIIVVVIARAGGDEDTIPPAWVPGGDWLSPFGNDDIVYSPPLSATDGGNGGFSEVCRARRKKEGRLEKECYILKFPRRGAEEAIRQSVRFEAMALEFLEKSGYRNAPLCRGQGQNLVAGANAPWYLMSCAPGRSLDKLMEEWAGKTFDRGNAGRLLKALCAALMDLHRIGVCHRDIKPRNIFWDGRRVMLIDFGSARIPGAANPSEGNIPGTDRWEAPEQASGSYPVGQMADVYSFGLIFCAVVLAKPFLEDRWGPLRARYGTAVSAVVGGTISEIVFSKLLAAAPDDRNGALFALDAALKREW